MASPGYGIVGGKEGGRGMGYSRGIRSTLGKRSRRPCLLVDTSRRGSASFSGEVTQEPT